MSHMTYAAFADPLDYVDSLMTPDAYAPVDSLKPRRGFEGELKLLASILEGAVLDLDTQQHNSIRWREAQFWVMSDAIDWVFNFENVCAGLGLEADYVRGKLKKRYGLVPMEAPVLTNKQGVGQHGKRTYNRRQKPDQAKPCMKANGQPNGSTPRENKRCCHYTKGIRRHQCRRNPHLCYCCSRCALRCPRMGKEG